MIDFGDREPLDKAIEGYRATRHVILRLPEVLARTGLGRTSIYSRIAEGSFPRQVNLGGRAIGWVEAEVQAWIERSIAASRPARAGD